MRRIDGACHENRPIEADLPLLQPHHTTGRDPLPVVRLLDRPGRGRRRSPAAAQAPKRQTRHRAGHLMSTAEALDTLPAMFPAFDGGIAAVPKSVSWTLGELISADDIRMDVKAATKREAIGHLAELLAGAAGAPRDNVMAALLRRERLGPTYIGGGFAMPHGRVKESFVPAAAVLRLRRPVDYGTTEYDEADLLVGITWPDAEPTGFVPTLASTWRLLRTLAVAKALREAKTPTELHLVLVGSGDRENPQ